MAKVTDITTERVVNSAALDELARARKRILELEAKTAPRTLAQRVFGVIGHVILLAMALLVLVAITAAGHRLFTWGWS